MNLRLTVPALLFLAVPVLYAQKYAHSSLGDAKAAGEKTDTMRVRVKTKSSTGTDYKWHEKSIPVPAGATGKTKAQALADAWNEEVDGQPSGFQASAQLGALTLHAKGVKSEITAVKYKNKSEQNQKHRILGSSSEPQNPSPVSVSPVSPAIAWQHVRREIARVGIDLEFAPGAYHPGDTVTFDGMTLSVGLSDSPATLAAGFHLAATAMGKSAGVAGASVWVWKNGSPEVEWARTGKSINADPWVEF